MLKIIISGCNGHMGRVVESLCNADPEVQVAAGFDGRAARSVYDVVAQGGNYGLSFEVGAAEYDSGSGLGGIHGHGNFDARMQALSRK